jgi:RNA polymerase sigma-70 factor, ECF subfamily
MSADPEAKLIRRCRRGEAEAWNELFDQHYAATARFVFQLSPGLAREDVEEICQEVFLSVIRHLASFNRRSRLQTWIFRIASNKARDYLAKQSAAKRGGGLAPLSLQAESLDGGLPLDPPSPALAPDAALIQSETMALVGRALDRLGHPWREVVELRHFGGLTYEEIGRALNLSPQTVSSRLSKSLDRLDSILRQLFSEQDQPSPLPERFPFRLVGENPAVVV